MKHVRYLICLSLILPSLCNADLLEQKVIPQHMIKGCIAANQLNTVPPFKVYYEGIRTISNEDGFFSIPIDEHKDAYALLICKEFKPSYNAINTIQNLTFTTNKAYKLYMIQKPTIPLIKKKLDHYQKQIKPLTMKLKLINRQILRQKKHKKRLTALRKRKLKISAKLKKSQKKLALFKQRYQDMQEQKQTNFWLIKNIQFKKNHKKIIVPDDCVIVSLNPKTVSHVENWSFPLESNFVALPKIVLHKKLETKNVKRKKSITRSSVKSELYSWEKDIFHTPKKEIFQYSKKQPNVKLSLVK